MGLASSQARLLSLTSRMHDIEYKAQKLEAQKLQMANKSQAVYSEYEIALNKTKVQFKTIGADGSANYKDANLTDMYASGSKANYTVTSIADGSLYVTQAMYDKKDEITTELAKVVTNTDADTKEASPFKIGTTLYASEELAQAAALKAASIDLNPTVAQAIKLGKVTVVDGGQDWLTNMVNSGFAMINKQNTAGEFEESNIATDTTLQEVSDEVDLKKAEAKYEADMAKINTKDKKFDTDIAALEQERNAIKTEMDTLKTVAKDNVERTFKLFS